MPQSKASYGGDKSKQKIIRTLVAVIEKKSVKKMRVNVNIKSNTLSRALQSN